VTGVAAYGVPVYHGYMPARAFVPADAMLPTQMHPVAMGYASNPIGLAPPTHNGYGMMVPGNTLAPSGTMIGGSAVPLTDRMVQAGSVQPNTLAAGGVIPFPYVPVPLAI